MRRADSIRGALKRDRASISVSLWSLLESKARMGDVAPHVDAVHVDVMDGRFVEAEMFMNPEVIAEAKAQGLLVDVHLMVENVDDHLPGWIRAGADCISVHPQTTRDLRATLGFLREQGVLPSVVVELDADLARLPESIEGAGMLVVMGTKLGIKGCELDESSYARLSSLRNLLREHGRDDIILQHDGGNRGHTVPRLYQHGADSFVLGSLFCTHPEMSYGQVAAWMHSLRR
jgi:ribulose-phosphate 3-epimerase